MLLFIINTFVIIIFLSLFFITRKSNKHFTKINDYLLQISNTMNSVRYGNLTTQIDEIDIPKYQSLTESINRMVETLRDREKMIVEYQNELMMQNKFLEAAINSLSDGILIVDDHFKILRATEKVHEWFSATSKKLVSTKLSEYIQSDEDFEALNDTPIIVKDNQSSSFLATTMNLVLEDKKKRYVILLKNVTNEKEVETLKEDFVATLTHDLKVPIIAESNMLELFLNGNFGEISEKQRNALINMKSSNKELIDLVQIVLETYKIKDSGVDLYKENVMLRDFLHEIISEMEPIADKSGHKLHFSFKHNVRVIADRIQLKRAVKNIIQNAIAHSESKKDIEITLGEIPKFATITIKDYGKGISQEDIKSLFKKYYSTARKFRKIGTGLGLYLAKQIAKSHGGDISVSSQEGAYTEFCIKLPM